MSFLTGTNTEVIASCATAGSATAVTSSYQTIGVGASIAYLPIGFFGPMSTNKTLRCVGDGAYSTTSAPTALTIGVGFDTTQGTSANQIVTPAMGSVTASITAGYWHMDLEITVQALTESSTASSNAVVLVGLGTFLMTTAAGPVSTTHVGPVICGSDTAVTITSAYTAFFVEWAMKSTATTSGETVTLVRSTTYGCN
jgi:hypothetical protein